MTSRKLLFILLVLVNICVTSQDLNTSPFSRYGIGEINSVQSSHYLGWSNCAVSFSDPQYINISNPASYSSLIKHNPVFDVAISGKSAIYNSSYNDLDKSSFGNNLGLNNMFLGLPISDSWGMVLGVLPFSSIGYQVSNTTNIDTISVTNSFSGDGSVNQIFFGNGFNLFNRGDTTKFSLGINTSYLFGNINHLSSIIYNISNTYNSRIHNRSSLSGWKIDGGIQFYKRFKSSKKHKYYLRFGTTYGLSSSINTDNDFYAYTFLYNFGIQEIPVDTLENIENASGTVTIPEKFSIGLGFGKNKNDQRRWDLAIQYSLSDWSKFSEIRTGINYQTLPLGESSTISCGYRITPNLDWGNSSKSILSKSSYSFGFHHTKSAILLENTGLINNGINIGISIPMLSSRSLSRINISGEIGKLGDNSKNKIEENYIKFTVGFSMAPDTRYDRWFRKRKYD
tara:strand:- start:9983 stop:11344 length:1362 start_codon:yes stop_codon:yes gene_type:complete